MLKVSRIVVVTDNLLHRSVVYEIKQKLYTLEPWNTALELRISSFDIFVKEKDGYVPWMAKTMPGFISSCDVLSVFSKRDRNSHYLKTESTCAAHCAESNNANTDDLFNIFTACSLEIHPYFQSSDPFSLRLLPTSCYWLKWRLKTVGNTSGYQQFYYKTVQPTKLKGRQTGSGTVHDRAARNHNSHMHHLQNTERCMNAKKPAWRTVRQTSVQVWVALSLSFYPELSLPIPPPPFLGVGVWMLW